MSKPKIFQTMINLKITSDFLKEIKDLADQLGVKVSDLQRAGLYMLKSYYENQNFKETQEEKDAFFKNWIEAARNHEKYFAAREFMSGFDESKATQREKNKKLKAIHKTFKKIGVE